MEDLHSKKTPLYTAADSICHCLCHPPSSSRVASPRVALEADRLTLVSLPYRTSPWLPPPQLAPAAVAAPLPFEGGGN
jgi:hypothetical protein